MSLAGLLDDAHADAEGLRDSLGALAGAYDDEFKPSTATALRTLEADMDALTNALDQQREALRRS